MAQHPFLKSIRPVNLLSFGPNTKEIELRPLNILIGANGSGKSNLIEILGLLSKLPDKDPWADVIATGGALEWIWKGKTPDYEGPSVTVTTTRDDDWLLEEEELPTSIQFSISLSDYGGGFGVEEERVVELRNGEDGKAVEYGAFDRSNWEEEQQEGAKPLVDLVKPLGLLKPLMSPPAPQGLNSDRSVLSQLGSVTDIASKWPRMSELAYNFERITCYRDWIFGKESKFRQLQRVGLDSYHLATDSSNVAQVLKAMRDRGEAAILGKNR